MPQPKQDAPDGLATYSAAMDSPQQEPPDPASSHGMCLAAVALLLVWLTTLLVMRSV